jgi:uncharacterized protein YrrD
MRFAEAIGRKIVSTATATTVGKVSGFVVDPAVSSVVALQVKAHSGEVLRWSDLTAFGADAVTVSTQNKVTAATDDISRLSAKEYRIIGKLVLTVRGDKLGHAADVIFDEQTGRVSALALSDGNSLSCRIVGIGSYAVVVEPESEEGSP